MPIDRPTVEHVARLARLNLPPEEIDQFTTELAVILSYVDQLSQVDTTGVEPLSQFIEAENVFRPDSIEPSLSQAAALANAPARDEQFFLVPKVIGG